jgi:fatty acid desaturase
MTPGDAPRRANAFTLLKQMISGGVALAKLEVQHAKQEMGRNLGQLKGGIFLLGAAAAVAFVFLIALIAFLMAVLVVIGLWWVALIVLALMLLAIGLLAWRGIKRVTSTKFTPEETIASVKEEMEWAKSRLLRRS